MTNIYFLNKQITARLLAAVTIVSLLMSAFPVAFFVANAADVPVATTCEDDATNLLLNSSFENPLADANSAHGGLWEIFSSVPGWTISGDGLEIWNGLFGGASDGSQNAELDGGGNTAISQIITTIPGATYELKFDFSARPGVVDNAITAKAAGANIVAASVDGTTLSLNDWNTFSDTFVATTTSTQILFVDNGVSNSLGSLIDNTVVCLVAKPTAEVDVTGNTAAAQNETGWMFGRDITTATPFSFTEAQASIGIGSLYVGPITNTNFGGVPANNPDKDKFIAEYFPDTLAVADFDGLDYDFRIGAGGDVADANQFYVNVYTNTADNNDFYDCRYDYAVTAASVGVFNTVSIDPSDTPTNVATRGTSEVNPCPTTLAAMPAGSHIRAFAINVGDTSASDAGLDAYLDKVVLDTTSLITTFDFEPIPTCELVIKSDTVDFVEEKNALAKALSFVHNAWLQAIPSSAAQWIWGDNPVVDTTVAETQTFVKKFNWTGGTPTSATLKVASDNGHTITLGSFTGGNTTENAYAATTNYNVASAIVAGENTLEIAVTNLATPNDSNPRNNPAGLIYELVLEGTGESCGSVTPITPVVNATLAITDPVAHNDVVSGIYNFRAQYVDNDMTIDAIQWAIRTGASCNANTGTVAGNVDEFSDASSFVGTDFLATVDTSDFAPGQYCFVVNPQEQEGETDLRATRLFMIEEPPARDVTICKYDDSDEQNPLSGWQLSLLGALVDTVTVPTNTMNGASSVVLDEDGSYVAVATGTWTNSGQGANFVDAEYSTVNNWATPVDGFTGYGEDILELQINSAFDDDSDWGPYNSMHRYAQAFSPAVDGPANFRVFDGSGETPNAGWYGDNQGTLEVKVYEGWTGVTSEDGCVTFEDVPYGSYQIDEILQDNWVNVSGLGSVDVTGEPEEYAVVNRDTTIPLTCEISIKSSLNTVLNSYENAVETYDNHPSWTANVPLALWIWSDEFVTNPLGSESNTFTETFTKTGSTTALLDVAADNTYKVYVNNELVPELDRQNENNYGSHTQKNNVNISSYLVDGENTLRFEVTNLPLQGGNQFTNPAGLLFNLDIITEGESCAVVTTEPEPPVVIDVCPNLLDNQLVIPQGYEKVGDSNECTLIPTPPVDVCPNIDGNQSVIPQGYEKVGDSNNCTLIPVVVVDVCLNLEGPQASIPQGFQKVGESNECTPIPPTVTPQPESRSGGGGGGTRTSSRNTQSGQVLGASTMQCGMYLFDYMKEGAGNDEFEVKKLQWFLIGQGYVLPVTGIFDDATDTAVKAFQLKYQLEVLTPWFEAGIVPHNNPTGWVYQLTRWKINNIVCPGSEAAPVLLP